jgi:hypothetical protein
MVANAHIGWASTIDASQDAAMETVVGSNVPSLGLDARSIRGLLVVSYREKVDYYCIDVSDGKEVVLTLDLFKGLRP